MNDLICEVYWQGPFDWDYIITHDRPEYVLYSIHGTHPLYGLNALLYIGMTAGGVSTRLRQHEGWVNVLREAVTVKVASIRKYDSVEVWTAAYDARTKDYLSPAPERCVVQAVETLLIYAHQPAYNASGKNDPVIAAGLRVFNIGKFGLLNPELSWTFYGPRLRRGNR